MDDITAAVVVVAAGRVTRSHAGGSSRVGLSGSLYVSK